MWQIWVDTGGTFTDAVAVDPAGSVRRTKLLSSGQVRGTVLRQRGERHVVVRLAGVVDAQGLGGWRAAIAEQGRSVVVGAREVEDDAVELELDAAAPLAAAGATCVVWGDEPAPVLAARLLTGTRIGADLPAVAMRLATTRGTNALLERQVAPSVLFVTKGFADLLVIGEQQRPDLFAVRIDNRLPLYAQVFEVDERIGADGAVVHRLDRFSVRRAAAEALRGGALIAAVALANSYVNDAHERAVAAALREAGFDDVVCSSAISPMIGYVRRAETAVVEAALRPVVSAYVQAVQAALGKRGRLLMMTSAGGLTAGESYRATDSLLSGPAGGVTGMAAAARASGMTRVIGFDMGGTSTDVARYDDDYAYQFEHGVGDARVASPALAIETVAAGGGSICGVDGDRLTVGPDSAGADPGPACYGRGGPLTLTDVNVLSGRIDAQQFSVPLDVDAAARAFDIACEAAASPSGSAVDRGAVLDGFLAVANERMASAIERVSVRKGYDPAAHALVAFGGAGGQHACAVAQRLGMSTVIVPGDASLLSAVGLGHAVIERFAQRQVLSTLEQCGDTWRQQLEQLGAEAMRLVEAEGVAQQRIEVRRRMVFARLAGQDATLELDVDDQTDIAAAFAQRYEQVYGYAPPMRAVEIESLRVAASEVRDAGTWRAVHDQQRDAPSAGRRRQVRMRADGAWHDVAVIERETIGGDAIIDGPALITEPRSAIVVEPGWRARVDAQGAVVMERASTGGDAASSTGATLDAARAELFAHRLTTVAAEMGHLLERTAMSTNVKQRLDFSCAVLSERGELVVNAPHLPVHLGALGVCVRTVRERILIGPGDVVVTNHPAFGGSHLPDVTVISGAFDGKGTLIGYVANRAHHAEIGGMRPGSMPPSATRLIEEGVLIEPQYLVRGGVSQFDALEALLGSGRYPSRSVQENLADLRAQVAANRMGTAALEALAAAEGTSLVHEQMNRLADRGEAAMRAVITTLPARMEAEEFLDDGSRISVVVQRDGKRLMIDVSGQATGQAAGVGSAQHPGNLNAPPAVTHSAVLYVLRLLAGASMPLNEGMMRPVQVRIGPGLLNPDFDVPIDAQPAVVGGNVETSQRVVDTLLKALRVCACSQGTMNNTLFGNERFGYYETVCGGAGAGPGFDGASAVHTHMTNTRITDVEVMEQRYPVRVRRFAVRRGSGGAGQWRGGDGVVRELEFLDDVSLSLLSQHRQQRPYGMDGGAAGAAGAQRVIRADATVESMRGMDAVELAAGDVFMLETPGGGGWGVVKG